MKPLEGRVALVTGTASPRGLGRAICNMLAEEGCNLAMIDLNQEGCDAAAKEVADKYNVNTIGIATNVSKSEDCEKAIEKVKGKFGKLDYLVNNAGVLRDNLLIRMSEEDWDMVQNVNLKGVFLMTKYAAKLIMKSQNGRIVNISSVSGLVGQAAQANYSSSKAGVIALTKVTAREFSGRGVTANAICPAYIHTDMTDVLPDAIKQKLEEAVPIKKPIMASDVAYAVRFFIGDEAACITGTILRVDGGAAIGM